MQYDARKKSLVVAFLLWWFLGAFGAHRMYTDRVASGVLMMILTLLSVPLAFIVIGFALMFVVFVWWVIDACLLPGVVQEQNLRLIRSL
jgi:TM2 domain-containing membrane protein YozV